MIALKNLDVTFYAGTSLEKKALQNIDLTFQRQEVVVVIGGNGAGKTTLLKTLTGEIQPIRGSIFIDECDITHLAQEKRAAFISKVFQDPRTGTCSSLTVEENMALAFKRGQTRTFKKDISSSLTNFFQERLHILNLGLEKRMKTPMGLLSGGERQAVSLIMATLAPSDILILDEHTAALDPYTSELITHLTKKLIFENNLTVLMVTHSLSQALKLATRIVIMNQGRIVSDTPLQEEKGITESELLTIFKKKMKEFYKDDYV